ncbi:MAG: cupin domain-containing protein [Pseudomonadota bacterium]
MQINADFTQRVLVKAEATDWVPSPMPGVDRKMLDRIGEEVARATTIVRFAPGSAFSSHTHDGGEEFLVLDGVFQDEHGDFPAGSYIRNPPTSSHTPAAAAGTTILVKLHQFDPDDRTHLRIATDKAAPVAAAGRDGVSVLPLFKDLHEEVRMEIWEPGAEVAFDAPGGLELFVVEGEVEEAGDRLGAWDWLRLPPGAKLSAEAGPKGAKIWLKTGHLSQMVPA